MNHYIMNKAFSFGLAAVMVAGAGCGIGTNPEVSECGGFETVARALDENPDCSDHVVTLTVDQDDPDVVHFVNQGVWLNCCGEHDIKVFLEDGIYVIYEYDEPEGGLFGGARCGCMCLFDFAVDIPDVDQEIVSLRIRLDVSDDDIPERTVWEGDLDLSTGTATHVIAENVGWCM